MRDINICFSALKFYFAGSVSSLNNSELCEISSTCSEGDNETSDGEEADIDTTDLECTSTGK